MLNIYYGRESLDKEKFIFERIGGRALIIVPDQFTLTAEKMAFDSLGVKSLMDVEIISMSRLGYRLLSELGGSKRTFIDKYGRHMILTKVAREEHERLQVFKGLEEKNSFLEMLNNFISELKQYNCNTEAVKKIIDTVEAESYTRKKLEDLYLLYDRYETSIDGKYTDSEDYIDLFLSKIPASKLIAGNKIWIYGFDSFAPKALAVLGQLMAAADEVNVVLTYDEGGRDEEVFQLTGTVINNLKKQAQSFGVPFTAKKIPDTYIFSGRAAAIGHLEKELYSLPYVKSKESAGITLVEAANPYNEAESAATYVLQLIRDEGYRLRDIKVICNDQENRGPLLTRIFGEYGIQLFSDSKREISSNSIVRLIMSLLEVVKEKYRTDVVLRLIKSGFADLSTEEMADIENYAIKYRIRFSMWKSPFKKGKEEYGEEGLAYLENIRGTLMDKLSGFEDLCKSQKVSDFVSGLYNYLNEDISLTDKILGYIVKQQDAERFDLAQETEQVWESVVNILQQMNEIMGEEDFNLETFAEIFSVGIKQVEIGVLPPSQDGLVMGTTQRSRSGKTKVLVVVGANEGILPKNISGEGLFSSEEKELFKEKDMEICKVDSIKQQEEKLGIYRSLCAPIEKLWISASLMDTEGNEIRPSEIYLKCKEVFPDIKLQRDVLNRDEKYDTISRTVGGLRHMTEALQDVAEGKKLPDSWRDALNWYKENDKESIKALKAGFGFTNEQEPLGDNLAEELYKRAGDEALSFSPSRLEMFSRCPFSHYVSYGLKPEERKLFEVAPREIGDIYHHCLMLYARGLTVPEKEITGADSPWMNVTREESDKEVSRILKEEMEGYKEGVFGFGNAEIYRGLRISDICKNVCWNAVEQVRAGRIEKSLFEVPFSRRGGLKPLVVELDDKKVYIEGKIDRVDLLPGNRVKIIDYKTGKESFSVSEAEAGYRLQLMIYLAAAMEGERKPAGVFYFTISEPAISLGTKGYDSEDIEKKIRTSFKMNGTMVDEASVIENIAGDFSGYSEIVQLQKNKDSQIKGSEGALLSEEDFEKLQEAVSEKVRDVCKRLSEGNLDIHPMKTKDRSACTFCSYKGICRFDTAFSGCSYNLI